MPSSWVRTRRQLQQERDTRFALPEAAASVPAAAVATLLPSGGCIFEVGDFLTPLDGEC